MTISDAPNFLFRIPDRLEELEDQENFPNFYSVDISSILNPKELASRIADAETCYKNQRTNFIFSTFDSFYYIIKHFKEIDEDVRASSWILLHRSMLLLHSQLNDFINEGYRLDQRRSFQNKLNMIVYAFVMLSELYEETSTDQRVELEDIRNNSKKKRTKKLVSTIYQDEKDRSISTLLSLLHLRLDRLFDPPHFLNNFINIVTRWIYKIIEHGSTIRLRSAVYFRNICEIITIALDNYQHGVNYCMKIVELLQNNNSSVSIISDLVAFNIKHLPNIFLINDIIDQIKAIDINILSRDSSAPRAISTFLIELGEKCTDEMFKNIADLFDFLEQDSYLLRNATLEIISIIIIKKFKSPTTFKDVHIKDKLLDTLEEHIHDITSYTRSRVLILWCNLSQNRAIPIDRLHGLIELVIGRLEDKSCFVRKNALHFLTLMLKDNPFNMLNRTDTSPAIEKTKALCEQYEKRLLDLIEKHEAEANQLINMGDTSGDSTNTVDNDQTLDETIICDKDTNGETIDNKTNKAKKRKSEEYFCPFPKKYKKDFINIKALALTWTALEASLCEFWEHNNSDMRDKLFNNLTFPEDLPEDDLNKGLEYFRNLISEKKFEQGLVALFSLRSLYPREKMFQDVLLDNNNDESDTDPDAQESSERNSRPTDDSDTLFLSSMTDFSSRSMLTLSPEITLAKRVFLEPIIALGNCTIEKDEDEKDIPKEILNQVLNRNSFTDDVERCNKIKNQLEKLYERLSLAVHVFDSIASAVPMICTMLDSRNVTDIQEAISFFTYAYKMEIENSILGIQKMLKLIITKEKSVRDALLEAFTEIYLNYSPSEDQDNDQDHRNKNYQYLEVKNLSNMILKLNQGELVCAQILIQELYQAKTFNQTHLKILWERYAKKYSNVTDEDSRAALIIIGMLASAEPSLIRNENNLLNIINISLETHCNQYRMVADTCEVLLKAFKLPQTELLEKFFKLPQDHLLFTRLHSIMVETITNVENKYWSRMSSSVTKVIYFLAEKPDQIIASLIKDCYLKILERAEIPLGDEMDTSTLHPSSQSTTASQEVGKRLIMIGRVNDLVISHFITMLGDVAINLLIHLDLHLMKELKIRQYIKDKEKALKKSKSSKILNRLNTSKSSSTSFQDDDDEIDETGQSSSDPYQEKISFACNETVLFGNSILSKFTNLIERIASDYDGSRFSYCLRQSACLTMAKFMVLSRKYTCSQRNILADILQKSKDADIRTNAIIAYGDLYVRFPNEIDHDSKKVYECLIDPDPQVKFTALKVVTRLILTDMLKPKGHISKIARLITDENQYLSSTAKLFFVELGKKNNNTIYNDLMDIFSNLSGSNGMSENLFQEMIKFLFSLLEKTRNIESLVNKLCQRFNNTSDERLWRDISFCLSQLQYNDRAIINLANNFSHFASALYCDTVTDNIMSIINNFRKTGPSKPEIKVLLDEIETKIKSARSKETNEST